MVPLSLFGGDLDRGGLLISRYASRPPAAGAKSPLDRVVVVSHGQQRPQLRLDRYSCN